MFKTYSSRLAPPFSGQVQIAQTQRARAMTLDGRFWEFQFTQQFMDPHAPGGPKAYSRYVSAALIPQAELACVREAGEFKGRPVDERILELLRGLSDVQLPFAPADEFEYWLLDAADGSPLAFLFSCVDESETEHHPARPEWRAMPAAQMPIEKTAKELERGERPVNARLESLVGERAGLYPKARWFHRSEIGGDFPALLLREDWQDAQAAQLCQRYLARQSPRLLMLHELQQHDRLRMEQSVRPNVIELARFYPLYPEIVDEALVKALRVEARLRESGQDSLRR